MTAAAMLFVDENGLVLLVERSWRLGLGFVLPGGLVETGETAEQAASREVLEELGITRSCGRLLVHDRRPGMDHYVFDGGLTPSDAELTPDFGGELAALHRLSPADAIATHVEQGRARLAAALAALESTDAPLVLV